MKGINMKDYTETILKAIEDSCKVYASKCSFTIKAVNADSVELQWSRIRENDELFILGVNDAGQVYITINVPTHEHTFRVDVGDDIFDEAETIEEGIYIAIHHAMYYPKHFSHIHNDVWFAVVRDDDDLDWDTGSCELAEAERMVRECHENGNGDAHIIVIGKDYYGNPISIERIREF